LDLVNLENYFNICWSLVIVSKHSLKNYKIIIGRKKKNDSSGGESKEDETHRF